jgi:serine/threonine protein phosphatase PrpC
VLGGIIVIGGVGCWRGAYGGAPCADGGGGAPKTYSHTDPNEDCVAFARGEGGWLVMAADGHHGDLGSDAALQAILDEFGEAWTAAAPLTHDAAGWREQGFEALMRANRAILEIAGRSQLPPAPSTFVLALVRPEEDLLLHLSVGDSHLFAVDSTFALELGGRDPDWRFTPFLGYEDATAELLERFARVGQRSLDGLRAIVLATDGLSETGIGVEEPDQSVYATVSVVDREAPAHRCATDTCRQVTEIALGAHRRQRAGDNMGCSVIWLGR